MTNESSPRPGRRNTVSVWPLIYLRADWLLPAYTHFELGIQLTKAEPATLRVLNSIVDSSNARFPGGYVFQNDVRWLLVVDLPDAIEHIPAVEIGMSFRRSVEQSIVSA